MKTNLIFIEQNIQFRYVLYGNQMIKISGKEGKFSF